MSTAEKGVGLIFRRMFTKCILTQVEDNSQPFLARATMDRECPYDPTALPFKVP